MLIAIDLAVFNYMPHFISQSLHSFKQVISQNHVDHVLMLLLC
jgi:hypothetical protein